MTSMNTSAPKRLPPKRMPPERLPIVGVMGSGAHEHNDKAAPLGRWLAEAGCHLLTGGGRGVMTAVSRAFCSVPSRMGRVLGVLPGAAEGNPVQPPAGYPNPWVEIPIVTHLPLSGTQGDSPMSRNHINILSSDVIIALPGGAGTSSEVGLALNYGRPVAAYVDHRTDIPDLPSEIVTTARLEEITAFIQAQLAR